MQYISKIESGGVVAFPEFTGERVYMLPFKQKIGLPHYLKRWQPTVNQMLDGVDAPDVIYLMIDQATVRAGQPHRRPGLHVDGYWHPTLNAHGGGGGGHNSVPDYSGTHGGRRNSGHGAEPLAHRGHGGAPAGHGGNPGRHSAGPSWTAPDFVSPEAIILASTVNAARGFLGAYRGNIGDGGDCSEIDTSGMTELPMMANQVYVGNVCCLHESLPVQEDCYRTLVRLNVLGWSP